MSTEPTGQDEPRRESGAGPGGDENWDGLVLDEEFVRGAEVREPAARTRMLSERWKRGAPAPQPWRSDEPPAGWIHSSGRRRSGVRRWFRRRGKDGQGGG
ncbi:hypothetical protein RM780_17305 [Streptomyces sp. DSM 44917]|uniref:Uncharacterized protein n=1 Tax=Streptomyces boetiae TaxID=3075541 RepID=A0ABU2LAU4_9ACTN|nr:hypothetical protein [Streptomyces sp. DSM 44917]MDT0308706.1 hypothetical protein [Streptomyces sp. DSM 44917]